MVAVKAGEVEAALKRGRSERVLLLYGPDGGLVHERARRVARGFVEDPDDPFQLVRLDGDALAGDPARLADEAGTIALFGGRRVIWVSPTTRNIVPAVTLILDGPTPEALVVVEAGDLGKSAPLRVLCERAPAALALPCYPDGARDLSALVDEVVRAGGLSIASDLRQDLVTMLGADRVASRAELEKLTLYAMGEGEVTRAHVDAIMGDVSAVATDAIVDAAFGGRFAQLDRAWSRLAAEGLDPGVILMAASRHALMLVRLRSAVDRGQRPDEVVRQYRGLHFSRQDAVRQQIGAWPQERLARAVVTLGDALLASRRQAGLAAEIVRKTLWDVATVARRQAATRR